jgi:hypothetical protein
MRSNVQRFSSLLLLAALLSGSRCEDADEPPPDCDQRLGADAKGTWHIEAEGRRWGCKDPELNGKLEIDVSAFLVNGKPVPTTGNTAGEDATFEADAFVERIRRAQYTLEAGADKPPTLSFSGTLNTCQVRFAIQESLGRGAFHKYEFDGFVESEYSIYGEFTGTGPGSCKSKGEFEVEIR